ncbi:hypothetical protein [Methanospirillum sp.]|uniref:hypothetical protein n=1 Tax=Methanospirillum sp. TaxID=45200 RepID=UPI00359F916C
MIIRAKIIGEQIQPLEPIPFHDGDVITIQIEPGLYSLAQELGGITASEKIYAVMDEIRHK